MFQKMFWVIISLMVFVQVGGAQAPDLTEQIRIPVDKYQLKNGLTVLLHQDNSLPIVSYHTWFRVGSRHEYPGVTGIAHLFEHLMFKGTSKYKEGEFDQLLQANGATNNAFTSHDYTGYYENFPSDKLELIMDIEADRMVNLVLSEEVLKAEREVVKEERRVRVDNSPMGTLRQFVFSTVFRVHPYRWPVIGTMDDLNSMTLDDLKKWYKTYYAPNNAVLVIAGDINLGKTKQMIAKYYGDIPSQPIPEREIAPEPDQEGFRQQVLSRDVQAPIFAIAYQGTKAGTDEALALDLLANILGQGEASRLHQRMVYRNPIATSVSSWSYSPVDRGAFQVFVSLRPGVDEQMAQKVVLAEAYKLRQAPVSDEELMRAKNQTIMSYIGSMKTVYGKAEVLALNEIIFGDYQEFFKDLGRYQKFTAQDLQEVAKKYLIPSRISYVTVRPRTAANQ